MDSFLSNEFKSRVEDALANTRLKEEPERLKEEPDAQMQKQGTKDAHKRHREDEARTEEGGKKGQCKCKANTTWQGDTPQ